MMYDIVLKNGTGSEIQLSSSLDPVLYVQLMRDLVSRDNSQP